MRTDMNFDDCAEDFLQSVYGTSKGYIRLNVLWKDLVAEVPGAGRGELLVLDAGGGAGNLATRLARAGNRIVLADISQEMLDRASATLAKAGLSDRVTLVHSQIQDLASSPTERFDLITCHAVLEWVAEPQDILSALVPRLAPTGKLSLMFYNFNAAVLRRILRGEFADVNDCYAPNNPTPGTGRCVPIAEQQARNWLQALGIKVVSRAGIRIFHDHLDESMRTEERLPELLDLEVRFRKQDPFASLGHHLHLVCERA